MAKWFDQQCRCAACVAKEAGATDAEILEERDAGIERAIANYGRRLMGVLGDAGNLSFTYTIGNQIHGLPELLVIGTHEGYLLNVLSEQMLERGCPFTDGELVKSPNGKTSVKIVNAGARAREEYTIQAGRFRYRELRGPASAAAGSGRTIPGRAWVPEAVLYDPGPSSSSIEGGA